MPCTSLCTRARMQACSCRADSAGAGPARARRGRGPAGCRGAHARLHRRGHERPAAHADVALLPARAHVVVVGQVDVEDQLALHRLESRLGAQPCAAQQDGRYVTLASALCATCSLYVS